MWIGMNDVNWEMHFVWTDGKGIQYTNWAKGHPVSMPSGRNSFNDEVISFSSSIVFNFQCFSCQPHRRMCVKMKQNKKTRLKNKKKSSELGRLKIESHNRILSVANKKAASFKSSF